MIDINTYITEKLHIDKDLKVQRVMIVFGYPATHKMDYGFYDDVNEAAKYIQKRNTSWNGAFLMYEDDVDGFIENIFKSHTDFNKFCEDKNIENVSQKIVDILKNKK